MSIDTSTNDLAALREVLGAKRDPDAAKRSLSLLEAEREELRKQLGTVNVAVELVRDFRDQ